MVGVGVGVGVGAGLAPTPVDGAEQGEGVAVRSDQRHLQQAAHLVGVIGLGLGLGLGLGWRCVAPGGP